MQLVAQTASFWKERIYVAVAFGLVRPRQEPPNSPNRRPIWLRVERPEQLRLEQRQLIHPRVRRHVHEQRSVRRDRLRRRHRGDLRTDQRRPFRDYARLIDSVSQAAVSEPVRDDFSDGLWPLLPVTHANT